MSNLLNIFSSKSGLYYSALFEFHSFYAFTIFRPRSLVCPYSFREIVNAIIDPSNPAFNYFVPDYAVVRYLANEAGVDGYTVSGVLVAFSNLLRQAKNKNVGTIYALSMRIVRSGDYFVIVNY